MRVFLSILIAASLSCCGCSLVIERPGLDISTFTYRGEIQEAFGSPVSTKIEDGILEETYVTRRPLYETYYSWPIEQLYGVPYDFYLRGRRMILGQTIRVRYDQEGRFDEIIMEKNGDFLFFDQRLRPSPTSENWISTTQ